MLHHGFMGFFDRPDSEPDEDSDADGADDDVDGLRPAAWIAGVVPTVLLLAGTDQAAVVLSRVAAYPDGFELTVRSYVHHSVRLRRRRHLPMMLDNLGEPDEPIPAEVLRFGLEWPDGRRATNLGGWERDRAR